MKLFLKKVTTFSAFSALVIAPLFLSANAASAQPAGLNGSYLGGGVAVGVTDGGDGDGGTVGGNVQGRLDVPNAPVSVRGSVLIGGDSAAIIPTVSYDVPITNNANIYLGAGYSFVTDNGNSLLGDDDAFVLTTGVEAEVARNVVVYGDAKVGLDAYQESNDAAVSLQLGAGYRF